MSSKRLKAISVDVEELFERLDGIEDNMRRAFLLLGFKDNADSYTPDRLPISLECRDDDSVHTAQRCNSLELRLFLTDAETVLWDDLRRKMSLPAVVNPQSYSHVLSEALRLHREKYGW